MGGTVLVPLCGASLDLPWLVEQGWTVVGVELSPIAVAEIAEREGLEPLPAVGPFKAVGNGAITVLCGDFFQLQPKHVGPLAGIWDRAALVAMHPDQRKDYLAVHKRVLGEGVLLLNVLDYDATKADGPPWAVGEQAIADLWPGLELLDSKAEQPGGRIGKLIDAMTRRLYRSV